MQELIFLREISIINQLGFPIKKFTVHICPLIKDIELIIRACLFSNLHQKASNDKIKEMGRLFYGFLNCDLNFAFNFSVCN